MNNFHPLEIMPLTISCNANRMADLYAPQRKTGSTFITHAPTAMTNAMNPDWVRADGLTAGAGTKTNCDPESTSTSAGASLLALMKEIQCPPLTLVNGTPCRLQWV